MGGLLWEVFGWSLGWALTLSFFCHSCLTTQWYKLRSCIITNIISVLWRISSLCITKLESGRWIDRFWQVSFTLSHFFWIMFLLKDSVVSLTQPLSCPLPYLTITFVAPEWPAPSTSGSVSKFLPLATLMSFPWEMPWPFFHVSLELSPFYPLISVAHNTDGNFISGAHSPRIS